MRVRFAYVGKHDLIILRLINELNGCREAVLLDMMRVIAERAAPGRHFAYTTFQSRTYQMLTPIGHDCLRVDYTKGADCASVLRIVLTANGSKILDMANNRISSMHGYDLSNVELMQLYLNSPKRDGKLIFRGAETHKALSAYKKKKKDEVL